MTRTVSFALTALALTAVSAAAQPDAAATIGPSIRWSAQAGHESFALRDISRTMRPPDASPISWRGGGVVVAGRFERSGLRSAHLADLVMANAAGFEYVSPNRRDAALPDDAAYRFDGRYEYRRYLFRDVVMKGLDVGAGAQLIGTRTGFDRHITSVLWTRTRISGGGFGAVASLRLRRWDRLHVTASWANGAIVSTRELQHSAGQGANESSSGGNWFTDTAVIADWRVSTSARLSATWRRGFDSYASNHYHYAASRQAFTVGISYAR